MDGVLEKFQTKFCTCHIDLGGFCGCIWNIIFNFTIVNNQSEYGGYLIGVYLALALILLCIMSYAFCVLSRFSMKIVQIFRFSLFCAFRHFAHTLVLVVILLAGITGIFLPPFVSVSGGTIAGADDPGICAGDSCFFVYVSYGESFEKIHTGVRAKIYRRWREDSGMVRRVMRGGA